jgi:glyoxylate/hydroxypyruvate reductase A
MTLLYVSNIHDRDLWLAALKEAGPEIEVRCWPDIGRAEDIRFALVWAPPPGLLASLPNLLAASSFGAGVEHILDDPTVPPELPIARVVDERLTGAMTEYVLLHVLRHHRKLELIQANQRARRWQWFPSADTPRTTVGVMGLGALGATAAVALARLGFRVVGWSRAPKDIHGVECLCGEDQRDEFLARCQILVCLLPLTPATRGILDRHTLARLPRGAVVINAGRGGHLVEPDLLAALESGHIAAATLDVFAEEPLPPDHPFWSHPKVLVTPHNAADSVPRSVVPQVVDNYRRALAGQKPRNLVDRRLGY